MITRLFTRWADCLEDDFESFVIYRAPSSNTHIVGICDVDISKGGGEAFTWGYLRQREPSHFGGAKVNAVFHCKVSCPYSEKYLPTHASSDLIVVSDFEYTTEGGYHYVYHSSGTISQGSISCAMDNSRTGVTTFWVATWGNGNDRVWGYKTLPGGYTYEMESRFIHPYRFQTCEVRVVKLQINDPTALLEQVARRIPEMPSVSGMLKAQCDKNAFCGNNIANALEAVGLVKSAIELCRHPTKTLSDACRNFARGKTRKKLSTIWLAYRYQYKTTLADYQEALAVIDTMDRILPNPGDWDDILNPPTRVIRAGETRGNCTRHIMCQVTCAQPMSNDMSFNVLLNHVRTGVHKLREYGLNPSLTNLWDLVPLSFVVDWFLPIGDWCGAQDEKWYLQEYDFSPGIVSDKVHETIMWQDAFPIDVTIYERDVDVLMVPREDAYTPSSTVNCKRIIDGVSMLIG